MRTNVLATVAVALLLSMAGCAGFASTSNATATPAEGDAGGQGATDAAVVQEASNQVQANETQNETEQSGSQAGDAPRSYTELYEETINSVVEIRVQTGQGQGQGSGFVYSSDGYIVTNQHVVSNAEEVSVGFASGVWRSGEVVGTDVYSDLAVIRVDSLPNSAEPMALAERNPEPGQPVAAIGSPLGFQGSITQGIVSGTNRSMPVGQGFSIPDTVQTDAAINPGNSGGPLVSMNGTVLGVNRAKAGDNIGFAISADVVQRVAPSLVQNGSYEHSFMGIRTIPVTPDVAEANDLNTTRGMMVVGVLDGGPADGVLQPAQRQQGQGGQATFSGGDVIVGIENQSITSQHDLARYLLLNTQPGEEIQVTVLRDGQRVTETLTLGERPAPQTDGGV